MSEETGTQELGEGDRRVLEAVDRVAAGAEIAPQDREVAETLAALAWTVDEMPAPAGLRRRIVARAAASRPGPVAPAATRGWPAWTLPLAASLVVALLAVSVWQQVLLTRQGRQLAELQAARAAAPPEPLELVEEVARQRRLLSLTTAEGTEFCLLKPVGADPVFPEARGTLVVAPDRQSWYLRLRGLGPAPGERGYRVWFHTDDGPLPGPWFEVGADGGPVELEDGAAPAGLRAVSVTHEEDRRGSSPSGPRVLWADQAMTLL
ncbi:MAG: anti-sigma factor [Thermoanaerobaculia bacterium]|nr:anti-sigma factor [Thermoanaerobaculia bacterium]